VIKEEEDYLFNVDVLQMVCRERVQIAADSEYTR
jgi:hypothetical protein